MTDESMLLSRGKHFVGIKAFDQMLVRAGICMLLIMSEFDRITEMDKYQRATEIILQKTR